MPVYDFSPFAVANAAIWPQLFRINRNGTHGVDGNRLGFNLVGVLHTFLRPAR